MYARGLMIPQECDFQLICCHCSETPLSSATGVFSIVSGLTNYGLGHTHTALPQSWMILFLVPGAFTIALGVLFALLLPASPESPPILRIHGYNAFDPQQREILSIRLREAHVLTEKEEGDADGEQRWTMKEVGRAAADPRMWLFLTIATLIYGEWHARRRFTGTSN